jgi:2-polyprenyl-6-methoxyphenol hydroxylase-like FAD-dependent oxidoreductase
MRSDKPIIIVGGGIAGMAAAAALARNHRPSIVLEQSAAFGAIGAGVQFGPNALRALRKIGIAAEVERLAIYPEKALMLDAVTGLEVTHVDYGAGFVERFKQRYALVHRADLHGELVRAVTESSLAALHTGAKVAAVSQGDHGVEVTCEDGRSFKGAALIGADGLWSVIRGLVVGDGKPRISGHITYRAVLPESEMPAALRRNVMTLWAGEKAHVVHYPMRGGALYNLAATFHSDRFSAGWDSYGDPEELHERFIGKNEQVRALLQKIETWRMWVLCDREPVRHWSEGLITLIGDAAHPMLQYIGQGAAMSLEDAVCLTQELEAANGDFAAASQSYESKRYLRTARAQVMSRVYGDVYHASGVSRELRNNWLSASTPSYESMAWMYDYEM